jgi:O-6-methylguanine DNA methyltransferase
LPAAEGRPAAVWVCQPALNGELARRLVTAARAVGQACGANPISLLIPCHRVIGGGGALGGFMGSGDGFALDLGPSRSQPGLLPDPAAPPAPPGPPTLVDPASIKRWLLAHERARIGA